MPELPTSEMLGQRSFQDRSQVVRPQIDNSGQQNLADAFQQVSFNIKDRLDQSSLQKAKIIFQKKKLEADAAFDQDTDFETHQTRYDEMLGKAAEEASKMVRNPRMQEQFRQEISLYQTEGSLNIKKRAIGKETDQGLANLDESLTVARENYLRSTNPQDREFARNAMQESIDLAQEHGYLSADKAQAIRQKSAVDLAVASVKIEPAEKQVRLLKENKGLVDIIPKDVRVQMIKEAEGQASTTVALSFANSIRSQGGDLTERLKAADKIGDVKVREMAKEQIEEDYGREKRALSERQYNAYDTLKKDVIAGKTSLEVSQENPDQWNAMSGDQQQAIRSLDRKKDRETDMNTYNNLNRLARDDKNKAYQYFLDNADKLSNSDAQTWSDRLAKPEDLDNFIENSKVLENSLRGIGVTDKKGKNYISAVEQMNTDYLQFQKEHGRKPNGEEVQKIANGITDKVVDGSWNPFSSSPFGSDKYAYELTPEERKTYKVDQKVKKFESNLEEYKAYMSKQNGGKPITLTDDQVNRLYKAWDNEGLLDGN